MHLHIYQITIVTVLIVAVVAASTAVVIIVVVKSSPASSPSQSQLRLGKATIKQLNPQFSLRLNRIQTHTFEILPTLEVIVTGCTRSVVVPN